MKKIYFLSILTAGLFAFNSCANDNVIGQTETNEDGDGIITDVIVTADDFVPQTRTTISSDLTFSWAKNDKIGVFPGTDPEDPTPSSQVLFTASAGGAGTASFNGSGWGLMPGRKYYAYYPYTASASDSLVIFKCKSVLTQSANNATSHLGANDIMYTSATAPASGNTAQFRFHHLSSIMKLDITIPEEAATKKFSKFTIKCNDPVFPDTISFNPTDDALQYKVLSYVDSLTVILGTGTGFSPTEGKLSLWLMIAETDLSGKTFDITLSNGGNLFFTGSFTGAKQVRSKAHLYEITVTQHPLSDELFYVDLGLPSGNKWAVSNLTVNGIPYPIDVTTLGDYYGWGELEPYYTSIKVNGEKNITVTWKSGYEGGYTSANYAKNTNRGTYTTSSAKLSLADDAAHYVLGGNWRMPSKADLDELASKCTFSSATINNVKGVKVTSNVNGNYIFMPLNGYINGTEFKGYTSNSPGARFWLSDCADSGKAYQQYGAENNPAKNYDSSKDKFRGTPIRPIYVPNN